MTKTKRTLEMSRSSSRGAKPANRIRTWPVPSLVGVLMILAVSAMVLACGQLGDSDAGGPAGESSTSENQPLTVEEYAQGCSGKRITDYDTVYELVDAVEESVEYWRGITPPRELREYHDATIKLQEELITASRRLRGSLWPHEYMFDPQRDSALFRADDERNALLFDLDSEVRETLQRHGCIE